MFLPGAASRAELRHPPRPKLVLRALVLLLIVLLLIFVGLMNMTGNYDVGGPVLGSILLMGWAQRTTHGERLTTKTMSF